MISANLLPMIFRRFRTKDKSTEMTSNKDTYGRILSASAMIGASSALNVCIGALRTKIFALLLGPEGFGLMGLYGSIIDLAVSLAGMGVGSSGVRQIAEAVATNDQNAIARTVTVLRRTSLLLGVLGACTVALFAREISSLSFTNENHVRAIALVSVAVLFRLLGAGQSALLQGMRRITDLAKVNIIGALIGTLASIPLVYFFRADGVALSLVAVSVMSLATSWWYSRRIPVAVPVMTRSESWKEASALLRLGLAFMASAFLAMGAAYFVRAIIVRDLGLEAAGLYSAAWTLGGLYVGYILQAMGTDFYPQLVGVANDHARCNQLVNDQTQVSLLLAGPGIIATLTFASLVIGTFYSDKFNGAVEVLRWICVGIALRVITWPIGYIIVAKNRQFLFLGSDIAWTIVNVGLTSYFIRQFGLVGAGMAFFGSYVFHGFVNYPIVAALTGFRWSRANIVTFTFFFGSIAVASCSLALLPAPWAILLASLVTSISCIYSLRALLHLMSTDRLPKRIRGLLVRLRLAPVLHTVAVE